MSVTFTIEAIHTGEFDVRCWDYDAAEAAGSEVGYRVIRTAVLGYDAAVSAGRAHAAECAECSHGLSIVARFDIDDDGVNVANTNARHLGLTLGLDLGDDLCGSLPAAEFLGYVLVALAAEHTVFAGGEYRGAGGARVIEGDFDATRYLDRLAALATEADRLGRSVCWS